MRERGDRETVALQQTQIEDETEQEYHEGLQPIDVLREDGEEIREDLANNEPTPHKT